MPLILPHFLLLLNFLIALLLIYIYINYIFIIPERIKVIFII
jgi:hypothetical protein